MSKQNREASWKDIFQACGIVVFGFFHLIAICPVVLAFQGDQVGTWLTVCVLPIISIIWLLLGLYGWKKSRYRSKWPKIFIVFSALGIVLTLSASVVYISIQNKCSVAPESRLSNCVFSNQNLVGADFHGSNLDGAWFDNSELVQADLTDTSLIRASFRNANLSEANLMGADLAYVDFTETNITGANFTNATLRDVDFTGLNLADVILDDAILEDVDLVGAIGISDDRLADILGVKPERLGQTLTELNIRLEMRDQISADLAEVCTGTPYPKAISFDHATPPYAIMVLYQGDQEEEGFDLPYRAEREETMATRFTELVVCVERNETVLVKACNYEGGRRLSLNQYHRIVKVIEVRTGSIYREEEFWGEREEDCPRSISQGQYSLSADKVKDKVIIEWLDRTLQR